MTGPARESFLARGLPRPRAPWSPVGSLYARGKKETERLPAPWVGGDLPVDDDWIGFRKFDYRDHECAVCGEPMTRETALYLATPHVPLRRISPHRRDTSGPPCHPVCAVTALAFCPPLRWRMQSAGSATMKLSVVVGWILKTPFEVPRPSHDSYDSKQVDTDYRVPKSATPVLYYHLLALARDRP